MYAGRKKCLSAKADRHNVFVLQGDTGAEIDVPRVLLRLPKDEADTVGLPEGVFKLEEAAAVLRIGVGEDNGVEASVTMGVVPAVGLILVDPAAGRQILRDAAFALDRIAEYLIHFWRTNLGYRAMPDDSWTRAAVYAGCFA